MRLRRFQQLVCTLLQQQYVIQDLIMWQGEDGCYSDPIDLIGCIWQVSTSSQNYAVVGPLAVKKSKSAPRCA